MVKAGIKVRFETPLVEMTGDQHVDGNIKADGEIEDHTRDMQADRGIFNSHQHESGQLPSPPQ